MFDIDFWRTATIAAAAVGQTAFTALYLTFPWWRNFLGRALFVKALTLCLLVDIAVIGQIWDWPNEDTSFVVLYGMVALGIWGQFIALLRTKMSHKETEHGFQKQEEEA